MKLRELDPELKGTVADGVVMFDCPFPACKRGHRVRVAVSSAPFHERRPREDEVGMMATSDARGNRVEPKNIKVWQASGAFPGTLTIQPSIDVVETDEQGNKVRTLCWHGFVTNGEVT